MSSHPNRQRRGARAVARSFTVIVLAGCSDDGPNEPVRYTLRVQGSGTGAGLVTSPGASPGLSCSIGQGSALGKCAVAYPKGTSVSLVATPNAGSRLAAWSGACSGDTQCIVDMSGERSVTATFTVDNFVLTVVLSGQGSGTVSSSPEGIGCTLVAGSASGQCSAPFAPGTQVTLRASAVGGSTFSGWGEACGPSGTTTTCTVLMGQPNSVTATFAAPT
jgi:List-Bact-rpt repeat protein